MSITSLFYIGLEYNAFYIRFPHEVTPCRGRLEEFGKNAVYLTLTTGLPGAYVCIPLDEFFKCNYERKPLVN